MFWKNRQYIQTNKTESICETNISPKDLFDMEQYSTATLEFSLRKFILYVLRLIIKYFFY